MKKRKSKKKKIHSTRISTIIEKTIVGMIDGGNSISEIAKGLNITLESVNTAYAKRLPIKPIKDSDLIAVDTKSKPKEETFDLEKLLSKIGDKGVTDLVYERAKDIRERGFTPCVGPDKGKRFPPWGFVDTVDPDDRGSL